MQDNGFDLHAKTRAGAPDDEGRRRLLRYVLRPPLAEDGLMVLPQVLTEKEDEPTRAMPLSHYISWSELLRRAFQIDTLCARCKTLLRLISVIKTEETIKKILAAMDLPTEAPRPWPARPPPREAGEDVGELLN